MKYLKILYMAFVLFCSSKSFAQDSSSGSLSNDSSASAKIYFIRSTGFNGSAINFHCFIDSQLVCNLANKKFSIHNISPGKHTLIVQTAGKEVKLTKKAFTLQVMPGENCYIKLVAEKSYNYSGDIGLLKVSQTLAQPLLQKATEETNCLK